MAQRSLKASPDGIAKAEIALTDKEWSKEELAEDVEIKGKTTTTGISVQTVKKFFTGKTVDRKYFVGICKALGLSWKEIDDFSQKTISKSPILQDECSSQVDLLVQQARSHCREAILANYSKIRLLDDTRIDIDRLYVDVHVLDKLSSKCYDSVDEMLKGFNKREDFERLRAGKQQKRCLGQEVARQYSKLIVLGKPGSGKTTFLRHFAVGCSKGNFLGELIPILLELRTIKRKNSFDLLELIQQQTTIKNSEDLKTILSLGKFLILLDGL